MGLEQLPEGRRAVLEALKRLGPSSIRAVARDVGVTGEAARQHLQRLAAEGLVEAKTRRPARAGRGRPTAAYKLTAAGENVFPKDYDALASELLAAMSETLGPAAARKVLGKLAEERVRRWQPRLAGQSLEKRLETLKAVYAENDAFMSVEKHGKDLRLIERNCPFFNVASRQPMLCSLTVSVLSRLLGRQVAREERFQDGAGRCVFRVLRDRPVDPSAPVFQPEP